MYRDCNQQMKQEQEEAEWEETMNQIPLWAKENRRILNEFEALQDAIRGKQESKNVES